MTDTQSMIERNKEFYKAVNLPEYFDIPDKPITLNPKTRSKFITYVIGELVEFGQAKDITGQADAMIDVLYFVLNIFLEMGLDPDELHKIVHKTNMAKRWDDGHYHLDIGAVPPKLLKPPGWVTPIPALRVYINEHILEAYNIALEEKEM